MGKASSAKKVARAARAGGSRRAGQRRQMGFPLAIAAVLVFGLALVLIARDRRNADAFPQANKDHIHSSFDIYTCVTEEEAAAAASTTTTSSTTTTTESTTTTAPPSTSSGETTTTTESTTTTTEPPSTSTTQLASNDVPGEYQAAPKDAAPDELGIHSHGDGLIHIHPFKDSVAGRKATLGVFLDQVGISMTNDTLTLPDGKTYTEGKTKCQGGKDGVLQVAKWDHVNEAAAGNKPNQIFTDGFDKVRLGADESFVIAFMPEGSTIKAGSDVEKRVQSVTDVAGAPSSTTPGSSVPISVGDTTGISTGSASSSGSSASESSSTPASSSASSSSSSAATSSSSSSP